MTDRKIRRGEIYYADLPETESGSVQAGRRPVLITQCDRLNRTSTTVLVAIVTSKLKRPNDETHVVLPMMKGLPKQSMVEAEQRKTISKSQLLEYRCTLDHQTMKRVTRALREDIEKNRIQVCKLLFSVEFAQWLLERIKGRIEVHFMERRETNHIPVWQRYLLTVTEAAEYYHIGENKLRMIIEEHIDGEFVIMNGNRYLLKRMRFENFLDESSVL